MPVGAKGFNGNRLREAREARGLSGVSLAELVGVTGAMISQYEHGPRSPQPDVLEKIANKLDLPVAFFIGARREEPEPLLFFRSLASATKTARTKERRKFSWHAHITEYVQRYVDLPAVNFPDWELPRDLTDLSGPDVDGLARDLRSEWGLEATQPVADVVELLERQGAIVARCELGSETLDAYSAWYEGIPHVILGDDKRAAVRSRFDAAHELCHLTLHRNLPQSVLNTPQALKEFEAQAQRFAGAFLLPADGFSGDMTIPTLDALLGLKPRWRVSVGAMIQRASQLNLITQAQHERLWIAYRRRWGQKEPYDEILEAEQPHTLRAAFDLMRDSHTLALSEIRQALPYSASDIEQLAALPAGYLDALRGANVRPPSLRAESDASRIIPFPGTS